MEQPDLTDQFLELIRLASTDLRSDVEHALVIARDREEEGSAAQAALDAILENIRLARSNSTPICQDTGCPPLPEEDIPRRSATRRLAARYSAGLGRRKPLLRVDLDPILTGPARATPGEE